ncbi:hypothetical protein PCE1_004473 [Barthelona sp. PCE]
MHIKDAKQIAKLQIHEAPSSFSNNSLIFNEEHHCLMIMTDRASIFYDCEVQSAIATLKHIFYLSDDGEQCVAHCTCDNLYFVASNTNIFAFRLDKPLTEYRSVALPFRCFDITYINNSIVLAGGNGLLVASYPDIFLKTGFSTAVRISENTAILRIFSSQKHQSMGVLCLSGRIGAYFDVKTFFDVDADDSFVLFPPVSRHNVESTDMVFTSDGGAIYGNSNRYVKVSKRTDEFFCDFLSMFDSKQKVSFCGEFSDYCVLSQRYNNKNGSSENFILGSLFLDGEGMIIHILNKNTMQPVAKYDMKGVNRILGLSLCSIGLFVHVCEGNTCSIHLVEPYPTEARIHRPVFVSWYGNVYYFEDVFIWREKRVDTGGKRIEELVWISDNELLVQFKDQALLLSDGEMEEFSAQPGSVFLDGVFSVEMIQGMHFLYNRRTHEA